MRQLSQGEHFQDVPAGKLFELFPQTIILDEDCKEVLADMTAHTIQKDGKIIAYLVVNAKEDQQDILFLEVDEPYRGQGFGSRLLEEYIFKTQKSWVYPIDTRARAFFNKVRQMQLPRLEIEGE